MAQPNFQQIWDKFPDHTKYPTLLDLFSMIGGGLARNIHEPGFGPNGNTCAVRISYALNYSNFPLRYKLAKQLDLNPLMGGDKKFYLFRVTEMRTYLRKSIGVTPKIVSKDFAKAFSGDKGIVAFRVSGWSDATGHIAFWDGTDFRDTVHDDFRGRRDDPATEKKEPAVTEMMLWRL